MSSIFILVLLSSALYIKRIDANVVIPNTSGMANKAVSECGRSLTLSCKVKKDTYSIAWKYANDISPIAKCVQNRCTNNPAYHGEYSSSFDMRNGIFDLTVINVTMKDNGRSLVCSDGSHTDSKIITVRDYDLDLIEDRNSGTITVTSGCVSQDTVVSFTWMKIDACNSNENQLAPKARFRKTRRCSNDYVCGNDQLIQFIEEIAFSPREHGKYHLKVIAVYGNESKVSDEMVERYIILKGEKRACYAQDKSSNENIIYIVASLGCGLIILFTFIMILTNVGKNKPCTKFETTANQRASLADKGIYLNIPTADASAAAEE